MRHPPAVPEAYCVPIPAGVNHAEFRVVLGKVHMPHAPRGDEPG